MDILKHACSIVNRFPQTQLDGNKGGRQPYLRHKASLKAPLCNAKPCSVKGIQLNAWAECFTATLINSIKSRGINYRRRSR